MWSVGDCKLIVEMMLLMLGVEEGVLAGAHRYGGAVLNKA